MNRVTEKVLQRLAEQTHKPLASLLELHQQALAKGRDFLEVGLKAKAFTAAQHQEALSHSLGLPYLAELPDLAEAEVLQFTSRIPIRFAKAYRFFPASMTGGLTLAVAKPWPEEQFDEAAMALGFVNCQLALAEEAQILAAINQSYDRAGSTAEEAAEVLETDEELAGLVSLDEEVEDLLDAQDEEPVKKLMNSILFQAVKAGSSDIHIDPGPKQSVVRNRVDGVLRQVAKVPRQGHVPLVNRVKVMAGLDISTKNQPQDGRSMVLLGGKKVDIRVSTIPTVHGERAVLRLLSQAGGVLTLAQLGFDSPMQELMQRQMQRPHGILLVTGPTGSGKTTTLYAALGLIDSAQKNVVTIEDPVEYRVAEYGQMQVNEKTGVTFAKGLRSMLRQDPDVIMVGEMRDGETAQIAIQAALTGHLVLSTLHTNDAPSSVVRLVDMGIEPFLVSSTVSAILAQRLVRKVCSDCKIAHRLTQKELDQLSLSPETKKILKGDIYKGNGCKTCMGTGYQGRIGVFELLLMDDEIRAAVAGRADASRIRAMALEHGMTPMEVDAANKVALGLTSLEELLRVVYQDQAVGASEE